MQYTFVPEYTEEAVTSVNDLVKSLLDMEDSGSITVEDTDECIYYLRKISEITGLEVDFDIFIDDEEET
jgi:hypothetical protein